MPDPIYSEAMLRESDITLPEIETLSRTVEQITAGRYTALAAMEEAITAYKALAHLIKYADGLQARLKDYLRAAMSETGRTEYRGDLGSVKILPGQTRTTWDARALDALVRSDAELQRILEPHRTVKTGEMTVRIE